MKRGEIVIIMENSGPWDNEDFYGCVGEVSHTDYGCVVVAVDDKMVMCAPENLVAVKAVPLMYEALADLENDGGAIPDEIWNLVQAALAAAGGE
jgi:hypothetical protein